MFPDVTKQRRFNSQSQLRLQGVSHHHLRLQGVSQPTAIARSVFANCDCKECLTPTPPRRLRLKTSQVKDWDSTLSQKVKKMSNVSKLHFYLLTSVRRKGSARQMPVAFRQRNVLD